MRDEIKIPLILRAAGPVISIFSALLLLSGFLYTYHLYGFFGVPVSFYFSLSDYVAASIERIYEVLLTVLVIIFISLWAAKRTLKNRAKVQSNKTPFESKRIRVIKSMNIFYVILFMVSIILVFLFRGKDLHTLAIPTAITLIGVPFTFYFSRLFFNEYIRQFLLLYLVFILIAHMYLSLHSNIYGVLEKYSAHRLCDHIIISFDNDENSPPCGSSVIGTTEGYIFIFDEDKRTTFIWSRSQEKMQGKFHANLFEGHKIDKFSNWIHGLVRKIWD